MSTNIRYFDRQKYKFELEQIAAAQKKKDTRHVDFLLQRRAERIQLVEAKQQAIHADDVAALTSNRLQAKAEVYFLQLLKWRPLLEVQRLDDVKIIGSRPHLGYASIVWSQTPGSDGNLFPWILYFCNFKAKFGSNEEFFENIPLNYGVTFFGLALSLNEDGTVKGRNESIRGNGLLFATADPGEAFENVSRLCDMKKIWNAISKLPQDAEEEPNTSGEGLKEASGARGIVI